VETNPGPAAHGYSDGALVHASASIAFAPPRRLAPLDIPRSQGASNSDLDDMHPALRGYEGYSIDPLPLPASFTVAALVIGQEYRIHRAVGSRKSVMYSQYTY
jgi:hypothetical protein